MIPKTNHDFLYQQLFLPTTVFQTVSSKLPDKSVAEMLESPPFLSLSDEDTLEGWWLRESLWSIPGECLPWPLVNGSGPGHLLCLCLRDFVKHFPMWLCSHQCFVVLTANYSCGGFLSQSSGRFSSPFYPSNYPNNARCVWDIEVQNNYLVTVIFTDVQWVCGCKAECIRDLHGCLQREDRALRNSGEIFV